MVDVFDLGNNGARTTLSLSVARDFDGGQNMGASCLGKAFFGGGAAARQASAVDIFNGATRTFDPTPPPLSAARSFLATVALPSAGLVLFGGGELAEDEKHPSASKDTAIVDVWDVRRDLALAHAASSASSARRRAPQKLYANQAANDYLAQRRKKSDRKAAQATGRPRKRPPPRPR